MAVSMKNVFFSVITSWSWETTQCFGGTYASIFMVEETPEVEATRPSEKALSVRTTRHYNPGDCPFHEESNSAAYSLLQIHETTQN
jgi:hypothetical protein